MSNLSEDTKISLSARTWGGLIALVIVSTASVVMGYARLDARVTKVETALTEDAQSRREFRDEFLAALRAK